METAETNLSRAANHQRVLEEAFALQLVEQVLSSVERLQLKIVPQSYDTTRVRAAMQEFGKNAPDSEVENREEIESNLRGELLDWRMSLGERDEAIATAHLRRFSEECPQPLSIKVFAALARYYRTSPNAFETRSKYDFAVTQMFVKRTVAKYRGLRVEDEELVGHLRDLNFEWTNFSGEPSAEESAQIDETITEIQKLIDEAQTQTRLEDLIASEFFRRLSDLKESLGELFYAPEITAAAIRCNVAVGNRFAELLEAESDSLQAAVNSAFGASESNDFAVLSENPSRTSQIVNLLAVASQPQEVGFNFRASNYSATQKLVLSEEDVSNLIEQSFETLAGDANQPTAAQIAAAQVNSPDFALVLAELVKPESDKRVLNEYLAVSSDVSLRELDCVAFDLIEDDSKNSARNTGLMRRSLRLILTAEDAVQRANADFNEELEAEIIALVEKMQSAGNGLRMATQEITGEDKREKVNQMIYAANNLLAARLRLDSAVARHHQHTASEPEFPVHAHPRRSEPRPKAEVKKPEIVRTPHRQANRWLIAATVLTILFGTFAYSLVPAAEDAAKSDAATTRNVQTLDPQTLKGGDALATAKVNSEVLIAVAKPDWNTLLDEQKKERLRLLLENGAQHNFRSVLLINSRGEITASASKDQVIVNPSGS